MPAVAAFNFAWLPDTLRPWLEDVAERMQCPADYPAAAMLVALGSLIGRKVGIRPKREDDWLVVSNLWGFVVGHPGLMKTPALEQALVPLRQLATEAFERYSDEMKRCKVSGMLAAQRAKLAEKQIAKALARSDESAAQAAAETVVNGKHADPILHRYELNDTTVQKLGELLAENPNGVLVFRDELVGFLRSMDKDGYEESRAFYLEAWTGTGSYTFDRIGRGTVRVPSNTVAILGGIQPDLLTVYVREAVKGGGGADGLLQRFQVAVWPDASKVWCNVDRLPNWKGKGDAFAVFHHLDKSDAAAVGADCSAEIPFLRFAPDAQEQFDLWREKLEHALRSHVEHSAFEAHLAKYRKLVPAIALILHLADRATGPVTLDALNKALAWAGYLQSHARRIYSAALQPDAAAARELAKHLERGDLGDRFTLRDVYRKGWTGLDDKEDTEAAVEILCEFGWLRPARSAAATAGRPGSPEFEVNPKIRDANATD
jgi:putative DNA primase/helicase